MADRRGVLKAHRWVPAMAPQRPTVMTRCDLSDFAREGNRRSAEVSEMPPAVGRGRGGGDQAGGHQTPSPAPRVAVPATNATATAMASTTRTAEMDLRARVTVGRSRGPSRAGSRPIRPSPGRRTVGRASVGASLVTCRVKGSTSGVLDPGDVVRHEKGLSQVCDLRKPLRCRADRI